MNRVIDYCKTEVDRSHAGYENDKMAQRNNGLNYKNRKED